MTFRSFTEQDVHDAVKSAGLDASSVDAVTRYLKDVMPVAGRPTSGYLYEGGPFSLIEGDVFSSVATGGGPLTQWLPTRMIKNKYETINHLEYVAPKGLDGSQTYREYLRDVAQIDECGYGPSTTWSGFQYQMQGGSFSWTTEMMKPYPDGGVKYYDKMPIYTTRGSTGIPLSSDREWAVARLFIVLEQHLDYVIKYGDATNSEMEWDGLDTILRPGYVTSRKVGPGNPVWADPWIVNGVTLNTRAKVMAEIRRSARRILNRIRAKNWTVAPGDMIIKMPGVMWDALAEEVAAGSMYAFTNTYGFNGEVSLRDYEARYNSVRSGGIGFGAIPIDGVPIPVMADTNDGINTIIDPSGTPKGGVMGDIQILTRRVNGINILEQQYVDWRMLDYPTNGLENIVNLQQGHVRAGWITESNKCYYYYAEMAGRVVSTFQPAQAVIRNVTVETLGTNEIEANSFYSNDFYGYGGAQGGRGTPILT